MSEVQDTKVKVQYKEQSPPPSIPSELKQDSPPTNTQALTPPEKEEADANTESTNSINADISDSETKVTINSTSSSPRQLRVQDLIHTTPTITTTSSSTMSDGKNERRALRVLEIMNDFRTLQMNITAQVTRQEASPPDQASYGLPGYALLRQCNAQAQAVLATEFDKNAREFQPGNVTDTEEMKSTLQRIILDAATRRFSAHKIYLMAAAAMRWILSRKQVVEANAPREKKIAALQAIDKKFTQERSAITDEAVYSDLRNADLRKGYWIDEDPSLERILAWIRRIS